MKKQIGCIGCGNMGGAIMAGLARQEALWEGWGSLFKMRDGWIRVLKEKSHWNCITPIDVPLS